jgi:hypothetical protein
MKRSLFLLASMTSLMMVPNLSAATCASTTTCTLTFDEGAFGAGTFGTVQLDLVNSNQIQITINMAPNIIVDTGSHFAVAFNSALAGQSVSVAEFTTASGTTYTQQTPDPGTFSSSPYGAFDHVLASSCTNPGSCTDQSITFLVTTVGGFTDVNQLVDLSTDGQALFAVDILDTSVKGGATGVVGVSGHNSPVPEPGSYLTLLLAGFGAMGFVFVRRRKASNIA